jgi:hypothetical protein
MIYSIIIRLLVIYIISLYIIDTNLLYPLYTIILLGNLTVIQLGLLIFGFSQYFKMDSMAIEQVYNITRKFIGINLNNIQ